MKTLDYPAHNAPSRFVTSQFSLRVQVKLEPSTQRRGRKFLSDWEKKMADLRAIALAERPLPDEEADELLWDALSRDAIGLRPPLEAHTITASVGEVREGQPRAVAMDELDWELLDEWPQESVHPQVPTVQTKAVISSVSWGQPSVTEIDDADLEMWDDLEFGEIPAKETIAVKLRVLKVERGQIDSVAIDDSMLEYFDL
jgi:hypothetical protein